MWPRRARNRLRARRRGMGGAAGRSTQALAVMSRDTEQRYSPSTRIMGSLGGVLTIVIASPIILLGQLWWRRARVNETGLEVFSWVRGVIGRYRWSEISSMRMVGSGGMTFPELTLANQRAIPLKLAQWEDLAPALSAHGIPTENIWLDEPDNDG